VAGCRATASAKRRLASGGGLWKAKRRTRGNRGGDRGRASAEKAGGRITEWRRRRRRRRKRKDEQEGESKEEGS
jgi:hypothetical protein